MASMTNNDNMVLEHDQGNESITDIQNYLQSFNKEIGEDTNQQNTNQNTAYYIDTSQVITTSTANSEDAQVAVTQNAGGGEINSYQTLALVPDNNNGGFVLIVQPTQGQTQVQLPTSISGQAIVTNESQTLSLSEGITVPTNITQENLTVSFTTDSKIQNGNKQELEDEEDEDDEDDEEEEDSNNLISVYDFEEGQHLPGISNVLHTGEINQSGKISEKSFKVAKKNKKISKNLSIKKVPSSPTSSAQYMCNYCNYTSNKRYLLSRHMKSHSEERPHKCGICERGFKTMASLNNHVNTHTGVKPHSCKYCDSAFTTSGELVRHVRYRHTHEKPHRCTECDYASVELSKLKRHMRCHTGERPYQCQHCTYASPDTYKLKRHLRIHTGEKPYQCDVCQARFTQSNSLKAHRLIHSGNKPIFKCSMCPTTCGRKTDLRIHVQKLHTSEKPLLCKRCDQTFPDRYTFKIHLKSHEGEKCFKCDLCNYASISARHLESHMLIHTDQKPYMCDECDQSFRQKQLLKRHKNLYHNPEYIPPQPKEKTHECPNCSKAFRHKGNLMRHLALHDPDLFRDSQIIRSNDSHQLIDDEEDEDSVIPNFNVDETTMDSQTLHLTLDQTQQMLNGEQVVVFKFVQLNNADGTATVNSEEQQFSTTIDRNQVGIEIPKFKTSTITNTDRQNFKTVSIDNAILRDNNYIIQLQTEDEAAATQIEEASAIIDDTEYEASKNENNDKTTDLITEQQIFDEDKKTFKVEKDLSNCFGFKDEDDEDEAILSMPAAHVR